MGNANNESTKNPALEAVREEIARHIRRADKRIANLTKAMNDNYLQFFEWTADSMYKQQVRRKFYSGLVEVMEEWEGEDLSEHFLGIAQCVANSIARGDLTRNSTSHMANIAHTLNLQARQTLIAEIEGLAHIAAHAE